MPRKVVKKKKRAGSSDSNASSNGSESRGKRGGGALSKFKEFDVSEVLQRPKVALEVHVGGEGQLSSDNNGETTAPVTTAVAAADPVAVDSVAVDSTAMDAMDASPPPPPTTITTPTTVTPPLLQEPAMAIPQLIPPEPLRDLPPDEEFVPLATIQVVPMMNRNQEAQSGLLKEPAAPASIQRVTQPGVPVPAMPTSLMQLLTE